MKRSMTALAVALWLVVSGCVSASPTPSLLPTASSSPIAPTSAAPSQSSSPTAVTSIVPSSGPPASVEGDIRGEFDIGGRSLYIECRGIGTPTVVLEPGEGAGVSAMAGIRSELVKTTRVCAYDRANQGRSDPAPTPRTAQQVVDDLAALLRAAQVPQPYVLVGHSAGGSFVWLYASQHPEQVTGFVSMNAVPFVPDWEALTEVWTASEIADERSYYAGSNGEGFDYAASGAGLAAATPPDTMPYVVMISTIAQCGSVTDVCGRAYPLYESFARELAQRTPKGRLVEIDAGHDLHQSQPKLVLEEVRSILEEPG